MDNVDQRLEEAVRDRNDLIASIQRIQGKKEAAEQALEKAEEEIRAKGIDPDKIDEALEKLDSRYRQLVEDLEKDIAEAREALAPYLGESDEDRRSEA